MKKGMISKVAASAILAGAFVLSGCGSSSNKKDTPIPDKVTYGVNGNASYVGDIFEGNVKAYDASGNELSSASVDANGDYSMSGLTTEPSYVKLQSGAKGKGNDGIANSEDDNRITLALSSNISNSKADLSLSSYLNKEYNLNVPSELSLAQKDYLLNIQQTLVYLGIDYNDAFNYAGSALTTPVSESAYSVLSTGTSTAKLLQIEALMNSLSPEQEEMLEKISDMLMRVTADYTGTPQQKKIAYNTVKVVMSSVKELASDGLKSDDVVALTNITSVTTTNAVKDWVAVNINKDVNFFAQGIKIAKTATVNPDTTPISSDDAPIIITTCSDLDMSGTAAVVCGPKEDNFQFSADFGELGLIDNLKSTPDGGLLLYMASSDLGDVTPEVEQEGRGEDRIKHTWVEKKYLRLNTAANALDTNAKYELIKDYLEPLFGIKGYIFENDNNPFHLSDPSLAATSNQYIPDYAYVRTFAATTVLHFTNDQAESTPNKEYMTITTQIEVRKNGAGEFYFTTPVNSPILFTAKKLDQTTGVMVNLNNTNTTDATFVNGFSVDIEQYFDRLATAGESAGVADTVKDILVKNTTQKGPIKIHFTLHEKLPNGTYDRSFIRNPGTFEPANFGLNLGGTANPYADAFDDGAVQAIKFKLILD